MISDFYPEYKICPSLLSADFLALGEALTHLKDAGIDRIHVDVMDGHFVPNLTFGPPVIGALPQNMGFFYDVHLMVEGSALSISDYKASGAHSITFHLEATNNPENIIQEIKADKPCEAGLSIKPGTDFSNSKPYLFHLDTLLIMTVEPGFGGQIFLRDQLKKIEEAAQFRQNHNLSYKISVDGGMTPETAASCRAAGADIFVAGTAILQGNIAENIHMFHQALRK